MEGVGSDLRDLVVAEVSVSGETRERDRKENEKEAKRQANTDHP